ncbi:MAG TPA: tetratricopeptide repeat protein [Gaiellaceae bacterium]|nr:tetratricopeptide repeat protein [Gaiellaceae bacterium]
MNLVHVDDLEALEMPDGFAWRPVRRHFGIKAFGVNAYTAGGSGQVVEEHTESQLEHEEIYLVLRGRVKFTIGADEHELGQGQLVFVRDPALKRSGVALTEDALVLATGGKPGEAFQISAWETFFAAHPLVEAAKWDEAIGMYRDALAERPDHAMLTYNLACVEARAGRADDALEHLQRAIELNPKTAEFAAGDSDFDSVRDDPRFPRA